MHTLYITHEIMVTKPISTVSTKAETESDISHQ